LPSVFKNMLAGKTIGRTVVSINPENKNDLVYKK